ncbi:hypothetical protein C5Z26_04185 [Lactobacillus sp. CBA3606]|uniref:immunoglobulin-like domain-containing protein n=1 Tax=Lactobacillus sp. CBA3606 TaxID=2099789 RepID=UPI000CFAA2EC|nr:immunoglobulin-like domain-containing protein [Lactobacillus sp. CBA3606]AVK63347.1 hypothetical protein C5Z26_04185 [Lactobacillus sp. CBA3606]
MRQIKDDKLTYKMYKKGRFWVFAGIMMTTWQLNTMTVRAATNQTSTESSSVTATVSAASQSSTTVVASSAATSSTSAASAISSTSASATSTTAVSAASTSTTSTTTSAATSSVATRTSQIAVTSSVATAKTVTASSNSVTSQAGTTSQATVATNATSASSSASAVTPISTTASSVSSTSAVTPISTAASSVSSTSAVATSEVSATSSAVVASDGVTSVATTDSAVTTTATTVLPTSTAVAAVATVKPQVKSAMTAVTTVESGTYGTVDWTLDSEGVLHIQGGTLVNSALDDVAAEYDPLPDNRWQGNDAIKKISFEGAVFGATIMGSLFSNNQNLTVVTKTAAGSFDGSKINITTKMFANDAKLVTVDDIFTNWGPNLMDMSEMFSGDVQLQHIDVSKWNTAKVFMLDRMFQNANVSSIDISNWSFENSGGDVYFGGMFQGATGVTAKIVESLPLADSFSSQQNIFLPQTFQGATFADSDIDLTGWNFDKAISADNLFADTKNLKTVNISGWNIAFSPRMFANSEVKTVIASNIIFNSNPSDWLSNANKLTELNIDGADFRDLNDFLSTFKELPSLTKLSAVNCKFKLYTDQFGNTNMTAMFQGDDKLTTVDLVGWDVSQVTSIAGLFSNLANLTTVDLSGWDVRQVTNLAGLFSNSVNLTTIDLSGWDVSNVSLLSDIFAGLSNLTTLDLTGWVTSDNLVGTKRMFQGDAKLATLDLSSLVMTNVIVKPWILDNGTGSADMFKGMTALATLKLPSSYFLTADMNLPAEITDDVWTASVDDVNSTIYTTQQMIDPDYYQEHDELKNVTFRRTTFSVSDQQLIVGPATSWQPVVSGQDGRVGGPLVLANITTTWTRQNDATATAGAMPVFDTDHLGAYSVLYHYTDQNGYVFEATGIVTLVASQASVKVPTATTVENGADWTPATNFDGHDAAGKKLDYAAVTVDNPVNMTQAGTYTVTYSYTDSQGNVIAPVTTQVTVLAPAKPFTVNDSTLIAGPKTTWSQANNFASAGLDANGTAITLANVQVSGTVDPTKAGTYQVTYTYTDSHKKTQTDTVTITVAVSKAGLKVPTTTTVENGADWTPATDFTGNDAAGHQLDYAAVSVDNPVNMTQAGTYTVTYSYTDSQGNVIAPVTTQVTVLAPAKAFTVKDSTLIAGPKTTWAQADNFDSAGLDANGTAITLANVRVTGQVDSTKPGTYQVTYTYTDSHQQIQTETVTITVVASQAGVTVPTTTTIENGTDWSPATDFAGTDVTGKALAYAAVTVDNPVKTTQAGTYTVTYSYTDSQGNVKTGITKVTVLAPAQGFTVKDTTVIAGPKATWSQADSFGAAGLDANGTAITLANVQVAGAVDSTKPGTYQVTYTYTDSHQQTQTATATITVVASQASVTVPTTTTIENGADWTPATAFTGTDAVGNQLDYAAVSVDNPVKTTQAGTYSVTYTYTDSQGNVKTGTTKVTVLAPAKGFTVKNQTLIAGPKTTWLPAANFATAGVAADGQAITLANVTVTGADQVKTNQPGTYQVTYTYTDRHQQTQTETATVTVVASKASLTVPATVTVENGASWSPQTDFAGTTITGQALNYSAVTVDKQINTRQPGTTKVTYSYTDRQGNVITQATYVTVLAPARSFTVNNSTLAVNDTWQQAANFNGGVDANGQAITLADVTVTGNVNTTQPGRYHVTYRYTDSHSQTQTSTAIITVVAASKPAKPVITAPAKQPSESDSQTPVTGSESTVSQETKSTDTVRTATKTGQRRYQATVIPMAATKAVTTPVRATTATSTAVTAAASQPVGTITATPTTVAKAPQVTLATAQAQATAAVKTTEATKAKATKSAGTVARAKSTTTPKTKAAAIAPTKAKVATKTNSATTRAAVIAMAAVVSLGLIGGFGYYFLKRH